MALEDDEVYKLVKWPKTEPFTKHKRYNECIPAMELRGHPEVGLASFMVPLDLYNEICGKRAITNAYHTVKGTQDIRATTNAAARAIRKYHEEEHKEDSSKSK